MVRKRSGKAAVLVALAATAAIAATKFIAAALTGSAAMASEGIHSVVDGIEDSLLLYGIHRAGKPPDRLHPFGYGRELYFWSFVVAMLAFALGTGASFVEGSLHLLHPQAIAHPLINFGVLGASLLFEGGSWLFTLRAFRRTKGKRGYFEAFRRSKDPTVFMVLFEDTAAILGLLIATAGLAAAQFFDAPRLDALASFGIGLVLAASSFLLARETKELLLGEPAHSHVRDKILAIAGKDPGIRNANGVITTQMGPDHVVAALSAEFEDDLRTQDIEACVNRIEDAIKHAQPQIAVLFVKPQTQGTWARRAQHIEHPPKDARG